MRDDPSTTQALKLHQGRAQGADQAPLAAIARVSAAKSETRILVLCLRMYSMKGVLTRGTNEETGSQVSWDGPKPRQRTLNSRPPGAEAFGR